MMHSTLAVITLTALLCADVLPCMSFVTLSLSSAPRSSIGIGVRDRLLVRPASRPSASTYLRMKEQPQQEGEDSQGSFYFGSPISDDGNPLLAFSLAQNQIILGISSLFTISSLQQSGEPGGDPVLNFGALPILIALVGSLPLLFGGYKLSRSENPVFTEINCSTNLLVLRLFGRQRKVVAAAAVSSFLGLLTGAAEELSFRGLAFPILAARLGAGPGEESVAGALLATSALFGAAHWSWGGRAKDNAVTVALQMCSGLWFGVLYLAGGGNIVVPALAHALYDAFTLLEAHVAAVSQIDYAEAAAAGEQGRGEGQGVLFAGGVEGEREAEERLRVVFFLADTDRNARLSLPELRSALFQLGAGTPEDRLRGLFSAADAEEAGSLSLPDFFHFVLLLRQEPPAPPQAPPSSLLGIR